MGTGCDVTLSPDSIHRVTLGERVRRARELRALKVNELDRLLGKKPGYISKIESGERQNPRRDSLEAIAHALRVRIEWLVAESGEMVAGEEPAPEALAPFDEAARWARLNGAPEWAIERVRTRQARLARDRTPNDYWMMIQAAIAEGDDAAPAGRVVDEDDLPDPPAARRRG